MVSSVCCRCEIGGEQSGKPGNAVGELHPITHPRIHAFFPEHRSTPDASTRFSRFNCTPELRSQIPAHLREDTAPVFRCDRARKIAVRGCDQSQNSGVNRARAPLTRALRGDRSSLPTVYFGFPGCPHHPWPGVFEQRSPWKKGKNGSAQTIS